MIAPSKNAAKKVTSKTGGGHSKATQHQQYPQNQIHFLNNFSVDESVTSATGPQDYLNGVNQNLMALKLNGNAGNANP